MGCGLPYAIGSSISIGNDKVYCITGDGGIQMNIQELQMISREQLPVKIILFNNNALGMIRHFQEMYFKGNYYQSTPNGGFTSPDFEKLADAYHIDYRIVRNEFEINKLSDELTNEKPILIEVQLNENTYVFPKLEYGKPNQDQEPLLDRNLYYKLMNLDGDEEMNEIKTGGGTGKINL